jgi:hypothetical protein
VSQEDPHEPDIHPSANHETGSESSEKGALLGQDGFVSGQGVFVCPRTAYRGKTLVRELQMRRNMTAAGGWRWPRMLRARTRMRRKACEMGFRRTACVCSVGRPQTADRGSCRGVSFVRGKGRKREKEERIRRWGRGGV